MKQPNNYKTSQPAFKLLMVRCPYCQTVMQMGVSHKPGDVVLCNNCSNWFYVGGDSNE